MARDLGGGGGPRSMMVYEVQDLLVIETSDIKNDPSIGNLLSSIGKRELPPFTKDINNTDRKKLDSIIFDALNLTPGERDAVYEVVINLVEARLKKGRILEDRTGKNAIKIQKS